MSVCLAYDGSVNGDWVVRYVPKQFAGHLERCLGVSHVETAELVIAELSHNFAGIRLDNVRQSEN